MISNHILRDKINAILAKREVLTKEKNEVVKLVQDVGISKQAAYLQRTGKIDKIEDDKMNLRQTYVKRLAQLEGMILPLNNELRELRVLEDSEKNKALLDVFGDIFTKEQMLEIRLEAERRMKGESGVMISFSIRDCAEQKVALQKAKSQVKEYSQKLVDVRNIITKVVQDGCEKFDESAFLKVVAPLNRTALPIDYITKIKKEHFIK